MKDNLRIWRLDINHRRLDVNLRRLNINLQRLDIYHQRLDINHRRLDVNLPRLNINLQRLDINFRSYKVTLRITEAIFTISRVKGNFVRFSRDVATSGFVDFRWRLVDPGRRRPGVVAVHSGFPPIPVAGPGLPSISCSCRRGRGINPDPWLPNVVIQPVVHLDRHLHLGIGVILCNVILSVIRTHLGPWLIG